MKACTHRLMLVSCAMVLLIPGAALAQVDLLNLPLPPGGLRYTDYADMEIDWPTSHGEGSICFWGDDKFAAVSLTIDDNNAPDFPFWRQTSADYDWKFTWFVIVHPFMWDIYADVTGINTGYFGTAEQFEALYDEGHEVELHGSCDSMNALNAAEYEEHLDLSMAHLESVVSHKITTFAYPCGEIDSPTETGAYKAVSSDIFISARGTIGGSTSPIHCDYLQTQSMGSSFNQYRFDLMEEQRADMRYSYYRGWAVFLWHGLGSDSNKIAGAVEVFDYLQANEDKYWVKPYSHVARYAQERESGTLNIISASADQISFMLTDQMTNTLFNVPLTVKFRVDGWSDVLAVQNGSEIPASLVTHESNTYALVEAVPDQGPVTLSEAASAAFTASPVSGWAPLTVSFSDISTVVVTNRIWDFGDGVTTNTTAAEVDHTYPSTGTYSVELVVSGPAGASTNRQADLIIATNAPPPTGTIVVSNAVREISTDMMADGAARSGGMTGTEQEQSQIKVYDANATLTYAGILVLQLPDLGGDTITSAKLSLYGETVNAHSTYNSGVDLYGLRWAADTAGTADTEILTTDPEITEVFTVTGNNGTGIMETMFPASTSAALNGTYETDAAAETALGAWIQAQYDAGAQAGDYLFLRLTADTRSAGVIYTRGWRINSADAPTDQPELTLSIGAGDPADADGDGIPDDWETEHFGGDADPLAMVSNGVNTVLEAYIAGLDPNDAGSRFTILQLEQGGPLAFQWSAVSGRVYSVLWTTNLLDGFQPLETNILWPQSSWTDHLDRSEAFHTLEVELEPAE